MQGGIGKGEGFPRVPLSEVEWVHWLSVPLSSVYIVLDSWADSLQWIAIRMVYNSMEDEEQSPREGPFLVVTEKS